MTTKQTPKTFQNMDTKVGDMLTCVEGDGYVYTVGKTYEVLENGLNDNCGEDSSCRDTTSTFIHAVADKETTMKYQVGDTVVITGNISGHEFDIGDHVIIEEVHNSSYHGYASGCPFEDWYFNDTECTLYIPQEVTPVPNKASSGGPSAYYDMPYRSWVTTNDQMEYLAENKWGKYAIHLKDIFKGLCRWGDKDGTTVEYDTRKVIYYGCRVLKMVVGTSALRVYLNELLDDKQFQDKGDGH